MAKVVFFSGRTELRLSGVRRWSTSMARYLFVRFLILLADVLPRRAAFGVANALGTLDLRSKRGKDSLAEAALLFGLQGAPARKFVHQRLAIAYNDLVLMRRVARGRERPSEWTLEQVNTEAGHALLAEGKSFLIASGHFDRGGMLAFSDLYPDLDTGVVLAPIQPFKLDGQILLRRLLGQMGHDLSARLRPNSKVVEFHLGEDDVQTRLLDTLARPGGVASIQIDAYWSKPNSYRRPFCGETQRPFALGAARIARLAQCPVFVVAAERTGPKSVRLHCSDPIYPDIEAGPAQDRAMIDKLVEALEVYVGRFRAQYPEFIGWERRWDAASERWLPLDLSHGPAECRENCARHRVSQ